ncbi:lipase family protein [Treponema sp.]|uniref:lipase family protein n=1 Tax=Treponema sp. TaxID=166 RepID=UPI00298E53EF|nr:lipase family protein [Treponema sp.]MCQ2241915.1 lipase family protein [Treponema sp.]
MKRILLSAALSFFSLFFASAEKIPFIYTTPGHQTKLSVEWDEKWFGQSSSYEYHHGIARIACFMSAIAYDPTMLDTNYRMLGISSKDIFLNYDVDYSDSLWGNDQCAYSIASKDIVSSKGKQSLVIVNIRGTPLSANEWLSNLNINDSAQTENKIHKGFGKASSIIHTALISYLLRNKIDPTDSFILITGHSRGAAVSNLLARTLYDDNFFKPENCYVYTFASPNVTTKSEANAKEFGFIWNIVNAEDIVPTLPFYRNNWHFMKYGNTRTLSNYCNTDQELFEDKILPEINRLYQSFFERDYCPFYTGPFIPIYITRLVSHYVGNVEIFYKGFSGLHTKAVNLMYKIFPSIEDEIKEKKSKRKSILVEKMKERVNEKRPGFTDYMTNAFADMHQIETYLSFLLVTEEDHTYSQMDYTLVVIEGAIESAIYDSKKNVYLQVVEGLVGIENQQIPVAAIPTASKQLLVGVPSNMEFEMFVTDDTVLLSPAKVRLEHFNAAGVYNGTTEPQRIYLNAYNGSKFKIGKSIVGKAGIREEKVSFRERKEIVDLANLKPEYQVGMYPELSFGTDRNLTLGIHYGIPVFYGTALLNYDLSKWDRGVDLLAGFGHKTPFYGRYSLDTEVLGKMCIFSSKANANERAAFVPELRLSLSRNLIGNSSGFIAFAFDLNVKEFNDSAFDSDARKRTFSGWELNSKFQLYPAIQFGIRF